MSSSVQVLHEIPQLDEALWNAWMARGLARDQRNRAVQIKILIGAVVAFLMVAMFLLAKGN
jgi:hypothetical protein